jgi:prophage regulatory protein
MFNKILRLPEVLARTGLSRSTVYARMAVGTFPQNISLGGNRAVGWLESSIERWILEQVELTRVGRSRHEFAI